MVQLFIGRSLPGYPGPAPGHYTVTGNQWVADRIRERLLELPELASRLGGSGD